MASEKLRKIARIVKEITATSSQQRYDISGLDLSLCKFFYRTSQHLFQDLATGDYTIDKSNNSQVLVIQNAELLKTMEAIQICYVADLVSSRYETDFNVDTNQLKDNYNKLVDDVHVIWDYIKKVVMIADDTTIPLILPQLDTDEIWVKTEDGYKGVSLTDAEGEIQKVIEEYTKLMEQRLDAYVEDPLKPRLDTYVNDVKKPELDQHVETVNKPELDNYTSKLEQQLQDMIDQAVSDKGLIPRGTDWFTMGLGNWYVDDLFNMGYINYPPMVKGEDKAGVVKKDITDNGRSQILRFWTTTKKLFFAVKVNDVWSEWQEVTSQTGSMEFTQTNHGFLFNPVTLDGATKQWVKANKYTGADGIAIRVDNNKFNLVMRGLVEIPLQAKDDKGQPFIYDEYYFLSQDVDGGFSKEKNMVGTFQNLIHISELNGKQVAYVNVQNPINLDYSVLDTDTADMIGIGTYKTTLRKANTIEDLKKLNLKTGEVVEVLGYYNADDGANHKRVIAQADDGSGVQLNNELWANIVHNGEVNVSWFGAKENENSTSSPITTQSFKKALMYGRNLLIPEGKFYLNEPLLVDVNKQWLRGISSRSVLCPTLMFPEGECVVTFYSTSLEAFYTRINRSQKHGNFSIQGINNNNWKINGIRVGGVAGTDKEGHVECQIFENIMCQFVNKTLCWGSHAYRNTFIHLDSNIANYSVFSDENQVDSGEATTFLNCGLWNGVLNLKTGCKFISCSVHITGQQQVGDKMCGHFFSNGDYEFISCHFEGILYSKEQFDLVRENIFYSRNSQLMFVSCNMGINGEYMTVKNAFFLSESTANSISSSICVMGGWYYYLFGRLKGDFVLLKGKGRLTNINQKYIYDGATSPKRYETQESFKIENNFGKSYIYAFGLKDITSSQIQVQNSDNGAVNFKINREKSLEARGGIYNVVNVENNVNIRFVLEVELKTIGLETLVNGNDYSLICLDENDNIISLSKDNTNSQTYSSLTAKNIGDTFTFEESFDIPQGTKKILYGVGVNSNLLEFELEVKKCYVELI